MKRSGTADLPLHGGRVPAWLAERMSTLGTAIAESVVHHYGRSALLSRLSDPFWFQAFGAVMGMDWHSSGITTSVVGALKRGLNPRARELGIHVCGGRGRHSRKTPDELRALADRQGLDGGTLVKTSRLTARVDNNAVADGFQIYLHSFIVSTEGEWAVVQQGMNTSSRLARRYHWHSAAVRDFTCEPHTAIVGKHAGVITNLVDRRAKPAQDAMLQIAHADPAQTLAEARKLLMPRHHDVRRDDVDLRRLGAVLAVAHERELRDFAQLLLVENLGPRTLQSLALIAEVIHGAPSRFDDPARFSFAHGGKDGHPFPVPLRTYDESIDVLRRSLDSAKLGDVDKRDGMKRLDRFVRGVESRQAPEADFDATLAHERAISKSEDGLCSTMFLSRLDRANKNCSKRSTRALLLKSAPMTPTPMRVFLGSLMIAVAASTASAQWDPFPMKNVPRLPDGKVDLKATPRRTPDGKPDLQGFWMPTNPVKHLLNLAADLKPGEVPLQPWAAALYQERIDNNGKDHPGARCLPSGIPEKDNIPDGLKVVQTPDLIVVLHDSRTIFRQIFLDGRPLPKNPQPTWMGYSVGHWEGDTLVVETIGQNGKTWLDMRGLPGTESLRVVERFSRKSIGQMEIAVTIDDPKAYSRPWDVKLSWTLQPDTDLIESICEENNKDASHMVGK